MRPALLAPDETALVFDQETAILKVADRCDRCDARAYALVQMWGGGVLTFCGHHYARHADALKTQAKVVADERHRILEHENAE